MTILAIDAGNTQTTFGLFKGKRLAGTMHISTGSLSNREQARKELRQFLQKQRISDKTLSGVVISSVVPACTKDLSFVVKRHLQREPVIVSAALNTGLRIHYKIPATLGADRICGAVAGFHKYGGPVIIIDAGTATTYDVVSKDGRFLGGAIAPGILTAASALHQQTAQLPRVILRFPKSVIGTTTSENIQSGILYGTIDAMEGMVRRMKTITGKRTKVILTGGFSHLLKTKTGVVDAIEPALVLHGARLIFGRVQGNSK